MSACTRQVASRATAAAAVVHAEPSYRFVAVNIDLRPHACKRKTYMLVTKLKLVVYCFTPMATSIKLAVCWLFYYLSRTVFGTLLHKSGESI